MIVYTLKGSGNDEWGFIVVRVVTSILLLLSAFDKLDQMPCIWESDLWCIQMDAFFAIWLLGFSGFDGDGGDGIDDEGAFATIRDMFANYYFAAAFWKINSHFLDPNASCATMFAVQIVTRYASPIVNLVAADPEATLIAIASTAKSVAPVGTLIVELAVGGLMVVGSLLSSTRIQSFGSLSALCFHLMVCIVPAPNDISAFALNCAPRHIAFASALGTQEAMNFVGRHAFALGTALVVGVGWGIQSKEGWSENNWAFLLYMFVGGFVAMSIWNDLVRPYGYVPLVDQGHQPANHSIKSKQSTKRTLLSKFVVCFAFIYSYVIITLGVQEESSPNMFANLKVHGGSNHYILPTGLLFHWFGSKSHDDNDDSHPFGGGVIRLENTTSQWLRTVYPADLTHFLMPSNVVDVLAAIGRPPPVYFNPGANRNLRLLNEVPHKFYRYTVPALEFKRLLHEAKERDQSFVLTYSKLPGTHGDEIWRATATEKVFSVKVDGGAVVECTYRIVGENQKPLNETRTCERNDLPLISYTETVPWIIQHVSMYHAYPIIVDAVDGSDPTIPSSIMCFGP